MTKQIRIDYPGDGNWVMTRCEGHFHAEVDHVLMNHRDDTPVGGFVLQYFLGNSIAVHTAGDELHWCSKDLLWMLGDYVFNQLGCGKLVALVDSRNTHALGIDLRGGFRLEATIQDAFALGAHLMMLTMTRDTCPWLAYVSDKYKSGKVLADG